jgi:hypothetical protein
VCKLFRGGRLSPDEVLGRPRFAFEPPPAEPVRYQAFRAAAVLLILTTGVSLAALLAFRRHPLV